MIEAFDIADSKSSLLLTSRYPFSLADSNGDELGESLQAIVVPDMNELEQQKHWIAQLQLGGSDQAKRDNDVDRQNTSLEFLLLAEATLACKMYYLHPC